MKASFFKVLIIHHIQVLHEDDKIRAVAKSVITDLSRAAVFTFSRECKRVTTL